jgi:hypothetical protein
MSDLKKDAEEICDEFMSLEVVQKYLKAKEIVEKGPSYIQMRKEIVDAKKNLKDVPVEKKGEEVKRIKSLEETYQADSAVSTYNRLKEEVDGLVQPIREIFQGL